MMKKTPPLDISPADAPPVDVSPALSAMVFFLLASCLVVWAMILERLWRRQPVLPYEPRRQAPWRAGDVLLILALFVGSFLASMGLVQLVLDPMAAAPVVAGAGGETTTMHPVAQLLTEGRWWAVTVCVLSAVVVAPIFEEFLFRVVLLGWLEGIEIRHRARLRSLHRVAPLGSIPIVLTALVFAMMHFRTDQPAMSPRHLTFVLLGNAVASLVTLFFGWMWLRLVRGASAADLGWQKAKLPGDVGLGLLAALAVVAPVYAVQFVLYALVPRYLAVDPVPLFLLALVLGTVYYRTHRVLPAIVLHMALNTTSLILAWLMLVE